MRNKPSADQSARSNNLLVAVLALGYFVDLFDISLFSVLRTQSLAALHLNADQIAETGLKIIRWQAVGFVAGSLFWGILADKRGRTSVLFGSIALYSITTLLTAGVQSAQTYAWLRAIASFGLAGEIGVAVTVLAELLPIQKRAVATTWMAAVGMLGSVAASLCANWLEWRVCYLVGGSLGLAILGLRFLVRDAPMFRRARQSGVTRGSLLLLVRKPERFARYLATVLVGIPIYFFLIMIVGFIPEIARSLDVTAIPTLPIAFMCSQSAMALGDMTSGLLSRRWGRRRTVVVFMLLGILACSGFALVKTAPGLYCLCALLGFASGYWAVFITMAAEQFGTNLRATVATSAPGLVRSSPFIMTFAVQALMPSWGFLQATFLVGAIVVITAMLALCYLKETEGTDLDFLEK